MAASAPAQPELRRQPVVPPRVAAARVCVVEASVVLATPRAAQEQVAESGISQEAAASVPPFADVRDEL